jgi:hypothetical protein
MAASPTGSLDDLIWVKETAGKGRPNPLVRKNRGQPVTSKAAIVERLGEKAVLLPSLIADALAANDRIKLRLSLLQEAAWQAQTPNRSKKRRFEPNLSPAPGCSAPASC